MRWSDPLASGPGRRFARGVSSLPLLVSVFWWFRGYFTAAGGGLRHLGGANLAICRDPTTGPFQEMREQGDTRSRIRNHMSGNAFSAIHRESASSRRVPDQPFPCYAKADRRYYTDLRRGETRCQLRY
jgi:hypothetical protein